MPRLIAIIGITTAIIVAFLIGKLNNSGNRVNPSYTHQSNNDYKSTYRPADSEKSEGVVTTTPDVSTHSQYGYRTEIKPSSDSGFNNFKTQKPGEDFLHPATNGWTYKEGLVRDFKYSVSGRSVTIQATLAPVMFFEGESSFEVFDPVANSVLYRMVTATGDWMSPGGSPISSSFVIPQSAGSGTFVIRFYNNNQSETEGYNYYWGTTIRIP